MMKNDFHLFVIPILKYINEFPYKKLNVVDLIIHFNLCPVDIIYNIVNFLDKKSFILFYPGSGMTPDEFSISEKGAFFLKTCQTDENFSYPVLTCNDVNIFLDNDKLYKSHD